MRMSDWSSDVCSSDLDGTTARGRKASDRGAYSRFQRAVAEAELTRFVHADYQAERFSYHVAVDAIARAECFEGKLVLRTSVSDFSAAQLGTRCKSLADLDRGLRVLQSDLEFAPVFPRDEKG